MTRNSDKEALARVRGVIETAIQTEKCLPCGCLHHAVDHLSELEPIAREIGAALEDADELMLPIRYGCLGCAECPPAEILPLADELVRGKAVRRDG
jgi:hypothetical protein